MARTRWVGVTQASDRAAEAFTSTSPNSYGLPVPELLPTERRNSRPLVSGLAIDDTFEHPHRRRIITRQTRFSDAQGTSADRSRFSPFSPFVEYPPARVPNKRKASSSAIHKKPLQHRPRSETPSPRGQGTIRASTLLGERSCIDMDRPASPSGIASGGVFDDLSSLFTGPENDIEAILDHLGDLSDSATRSVMHGEQDQTHSPSAFEMDPLLYPGLSHVQAQRIKAALLSSNTEMVQSTATFLVTNDAPSPGSTMPQPCLRYLPLCPTNPDRHLKRITKDTELAILFSHKVRIADNPHYPSSGTVKWPKDTLPIELFEIILEHLSRDDLQSMRLVSREFEEKVSGSLFQTSVVPFNTELYDMIDEDTRRVHRGGGRPLDSLPGINKQHTNGTEFPQNDEGIDNSNGGLHWQNAREDTDGKVYKGHGLHVFQGFGPHIKRFGMSFEVTETQLAGVPAKSELDHVSSYFGSYNWPSEQYPRFAGLAGLEQAADETLRMKAAFSNLQAVQELALSLDSGLGWLNGPDRSLRASIFQRASPVFGSRRGGLNDQMRKATHFWLALHRMHWSLGIYDIPKEIVLAYKALHTRPSELLVQLGARQSDPCSWSSMPARVAVTPGTSGSRSDTNDCGIIYTTSNHPDLAHSVLSSKNGMNPATLLKEQKEWLLETEWAQRAFLECYILAIVDNPAVFANVKTLKLAKVSSGLLPALAREMFWDALPSLTDVTILVKPDWRSVDKDLAGLAQTLPSNPSTAVHMLYGSILRTWIASRKSITKLEVGWVGGGEHAEGMFARNVHLLPAPIVSLEQSMAANPALGLTLKHVTHLTLTNCWITPPVLQGLVKTHADLSIQYLTLNSVSMTAHPRFPPGAAAQQQQQQQQQQLNHHQQLQHWGQNFAAGPHANLMPPQLMAQQHVPFQMAFQQQVNAPHLGHAVQMPPIGPAVPPGHVQNAQAAAFLGAYNGNGAQGVQGNLMPPALTGPFHLGAPGSNMAHAHADQDSESWYSDHREGSWPDVIDSISPGPVLSDYSGPRNAPAELRRERPVGKLLKIEFISCGYAKLGNHATPFDQHALEAGHFPQLSPWFRARQATLSPFMMNTQDRYLARIVQHMPPRELDALRLAWGLTEGWNDRDKAEEVEWDGLAPGGTGRFSGQIERDMPL